MNGFFNQTETGRPVTIKDEGITLTPNVGSIDFAGAGVSGSVVGVAITETISGGGSITGTGVSGQVAYWNGTSSLTGNANFVFNGSNLGIASSGTLVGALTVGQVAAPKSVVLPGFDGTNALLTIGSFDNTPSILGLVVIDHPDDYTGVANLTLVGDVSYQAPAFKIVDSFYSNLITFNADAQWIMEGSSGLFEYSGTYGLIFNNIATDSITGIRLFGGTSAGYLEIKNSTASTPTSGDRNFARVTGTFSPTSGTATYKTFVIAPTINQTGGANGITRGLYINPTLTAAADFRAIETTSGKTILNGSGLEVNGAYLSGSGGGYTGLFLGNNGAGATGNSELWIGDDGSGNSTICGNTGSRYVGIGAISPSGLQAHLHVGAINNSEVIFRLEGAGGGAGNPTENTHLSKGTTTNATATTIGTYSVSNGYCFQFDTRVVGHRTGGSAGTADDSASYWLRSTFKYTGGAIVQIGTTDKLAHEDQAGWDANWVISGNDLLLQVTGATNNNIAWSAISRVMLLYN